MKYSTERLLLLVCALTAPVLADQVSLKNGDRLTGKIVSADDKVLTLKTEFAGDVKINRAAIVSIVSDEALNVTLKDAGTVQAKLGGGPDSIEVKKTGGETLNVKPEALTAVRDAASQKAFERAEERLHHPRLNDFWSGFLTLNVANASGNSSTTAISTAGSAVRAAGRNKLTLGFAQLYATQSTTYPHGQTANKISGSARIDRDVNRRLFAFGVNAYDYDKFQNLDLRVVAGGGFGFHVWKKPKGFLDLGGGGNWNREKFSLPGAAGSSASPVAATLIRNSGEAMVNQEFGYLLGRVKLSERTGFFPNMSQTGEYRLNFDATASVPVMKWLEWNVGFTNRYLSNPVFGNKANDTILATGIRLSFDQTKR